MANLVIIAGSLAVGKMTVAEALKDKNHYISTHFINIYFIYNHKNPVSTFAQTGFFYRFRYRKKRYLFCLCSYFLI